MAKRQWFAIVGIGRDRPGIVADLGECVFDCGCNLEDASMTALGNEFATVMLASGTANDVGERLATATRRLEQQCNLTISVRPLEEAPPPRHQDPAQRREYALTAVGVDKAGIVASVARTLADKGVSITDLRGFISPAPQSGTPIYTLKIRMDLPKGLTATELKDELADVSSRLNVDIRIEEEVAAHASI